MRLESWRSTLRRAAIILAGRIPTEEEYASTRGASVNEFRAVIRNLMQGPEFHEFLIRASNDRLLTDRDPVGMGIIDPAFGHFVKYTNELYRLSEVAFANSGDPYSQERNAYESGVQHGAKRAPLELIAHVVENDLPYSEVLTADYVMANPFAAHAYGASTRFDSPSDVHEFKPSQIVSYYRHGEGFDQQYNAEISHYRIRNPGPLITRWPHAGVLNTKAFLQRYPTTATNRNRARSRWTYYHFLGLDIEKSASRTTDPVALADTNNPTMNNPNCTVCHQVLDPVAGAFQNYGNEGYFRDQWGGMDSLDEFYKTKSADAQAIRGQSWSERATLSWSVPLQAGSATLGLIYTNDFYDDESGDDGRIYLDRLDVVDDLGAVVVSREFEDLGPPFNETGGHYCGGRRYNPDTGEEDHIDLWNGGPECGFFIELEVPTDGVYGIEMVAWAEPHRLYGTGGLARISVAGNPYRAGDVWYRDMREPGFDGETVSDAERGLQWLAGKIVADERFAEATVKFWWLAILGAEVLEVPEVESDADFEGLLLASTAQASEVARLARGFRRGFGGGPPHNLKDLLVEIVLSRWFRSYSLGEQDAIAASALGVAGANRLLTPEELSRKTAALTGFTWGRLREGSQAWRPINEQRGDNLTDGEAYRLLYGGIDSDGVTERAGDVTTVMAGVAKSHALESSCPIVMKDFYLLPREDLRLFAGIDRSISPVSEFSEHFLIHAESWTERETLRLSGRLTAGRNTVGMVFPNNDGGEGGDRNVRLYWANVLSSDGEVVFESSLKNLTPPVAPWGECGHASDWNSETGKHDHFNLHSSCAPVLFDFDVPLTGTYTIEIVAWADQYGEEVAALDVYLASDSSRSAGGKEIKVKLAELYEALLGVSASVNSVAIDDTYRLFVDVWNRKRTSEYGDFNAWGEGIDCDWGSDQTYLDGIVDDAFVWRGDWDWGEGYGWDWERINTHFETIDWSDPHGVARTWVVVLAYLMMDYRYLYL